MLSLLFGIAFLFIFGFMALMALGVIGGTIKVVHSVLTSPTAKEAAQVKRDLLRYYERGDIKRAEEMYKQLPGWDVTRQLRQTAAAHHQYHIKLAEATVFFNNSHGFAHRLQESASLFPEYAELAGVIVGLSGHVNGSFRRLHPESQQALEGRRYELQEIVRHICAMQIEVQKSFTNRDPYSAQAVSDSLAQQYAQLRAMNQANEQYRRIAGNV